jgi:hypothetical protein
MSSVLDTSIIDVLVPILDGVRDTVNVLVGNRQWNVTVVTRVWPSGRRSDASAGPPTVTELLLDPQPLVEFEGSEKGVTYEMKGAGREEEGFCTLREVSLAYSEDQLAPTALGPDTEFYYRLTDAHGQNVPARHYIPQGPPAPDRVKDIGWKIRLRRRHVNE